MKLKSIIKAIRCIGEWVMVRFTALPPMPRASRPCERECVCAAIVTLFLYSPLIAQECNIAWQPFSSGIVGGNVLNPSVRALAIWDGDLIAGGNFRYAGGITVNHIARWDGSSWNALHTGMDGPFSLTHVYAIAVWNGDLIVGGSFTMAGGQTVNHIARWDGSAWHPFTSGGQVGVNDFVFDLTVWNGDLIAGGWFTTAGGQVVNRVARWDGSAWNPLTSGGQIGVSDGVSFTHVNAMIEWNEDLIVGGDFLTAGGQTVNHVARWDGSAWHPFTVGGQIGLDGFVFDLALWNGELIAGGTFWSAGGQTVSGIAQWDGSVWHPFTAGGQIGVGGEVYALTLWNNDLIAGGQFTTAGGQSVNRIARWDGSAWHPFTIGGQIGLNGFVFDLASWNGDMVAGGTFNGHITRWGFLDGEERYWTGPADGSGSGSFHNSANWFCGIVPSGVASVIFDSTAVPIAPAYTIALTDDVLARRLITRTDDVTFNLNNRNVFLTAADDDPWPSLIVGEYADEDTRLTVRNTLALPRRLYATSLSIGDGEDSIGRLTVRNTSQVSPQSAGLTADGNITLGRLGHGTLIVENRADVTYGTSGSHVRIGDAAQGSLIVRTGGQLIGEDFIDTITIGREPASVGDVLIDGAGSMWISASDDFFIGESSDASLTISNGGALYSATTGQLRLASNAGSTANVTVTGEGSIWSEGIQVITLGGEGEASLNIFDGGMIESPSVNNFEGGTIAGDGELWADVFNIGEVAPGTDGAGGALTIAGNYRQIGPPPGGGLDESGQLHITVADAGSSSLLVTGTAELGGGLSVDLAPGANPKLGQSFEALTAGSIDSQFDRFDVAFMPGMTDGRFMRVCYGPACGAAAGSSSVTITVEELSTLFGFGDPESVNLEGQPTDLAVGNLIGADGLDIAVTLQGASINDPGEVVVLHNVNGDGTVFQATFYTIGRDPSAVVAGDFNGNGLLDLAVANRQDNEIMILHNDGTGGFVVGAPVAAGIAPSGLAAADARGIGVLDLAVTSYGDDTVRILENDGNASFSQVQSILVGNGPRGIAAANLVSGSIDLAVTNFDDGTVSLLQNDGAGGYTQIGALHSGQGAWFVSPADLDDDKDIDIDLVISNSIEGTVAVIINNGDGTFAPAVSLPVGLQTGPVTTWDIDGDGVTPDLAVVTEDAELGRIVRVLRNDTEPGGQLTFALADVLGENESPVLVATGDVTGNELEDLITINAATMIQGGQSGSRSGSGKAEATVTLRPNLTGDIRPGVAGDLNGDGVVDVSDLLILLAAWGPCPRGSSCPADLNGDGAVDVSDLLILLANWG